jgi:hypothetical protein
MVGVRRAWPSKMGGLGTVNYAKESNLRINNDNLAKERLYYYNLYAKNYYFRNALSLF